MYGGTIGLKVDMTPALLRIEVNDDGPGFTPTVGQPGLEQTSGRGLFLIEQLADRWGVTTDAETSGTSVWAEIDLI